MDRKPQLSGPIADRGLLLSTFDQRIVNPVRPAYGCHRRA